MQKIPTLFVRDENDRRYVTEQVTPGCEWVLAGEGVATRQYNGVCVLYDPTLGVDDLGVPLSTVPQLQGWWVRRVVKEGQDIPPGFVPVDADPAGRRAIGWEPADTSPCARWLEEAVTAAAGRGDGPGTGTHELIGQKINRNPEKVKGHRLIAHADADVLDAPRTYEGLRTWLPTQPYEGVVFHHPDRRMAKAKRRDFRA